MGLDGVEIVMAVEEGFDIRIENAEAEQIRTPGDLINLVANKVGCAHTAACLSQRAFNRVRKVLADRCDVERKLITPGTDLRNVLPPEHRNVLLGHLRSDLQIGSTPALERRAVVTYPLIAAALLAGAAMASTLWKFNGAAAVLAGGATAALFGFVAEKSTRWLRTEFPGHLRTIGHLSHWIVAHSPSLAGTAVTAWTRDQIALRVREIVIDQLGCEEQYREDARFIEDLGMS